MPVYKSSGFLLLVLNLSLMCDTGVQRKRLIIHFACLFYTIFSVVSNSMVSHLFTSIVGVPSFILRHC